MIRTSGFLILLVASMLLALASTVTVRLGPSWDLVLGTLPVPVLLTWLAMQMLVNRW